HIVVAQHGNTTVTLFPNPVSERLQLLHDLDHVEHLTLTISNQYGQIVQTATGVATLDVDNLPTGQYVLHVQHPTVQHQIIFVKTQ
ncbi:MAG: T9SS type A sorting domain-containing protein, partial [Bacteroidota bacterium]